MKNGGRYIFHRLMPSLKAIQDLARGLSLLECHPVHQKVAGSKSGQGMYLGRGLVPGLGAYGWQLNDSLSH